MEAQSCDDEFDHATCVVAGVVVCSDTEIANASQQFVGIRIGADLVRLVVLSLFLVFVLVPLYWMVMTSVKPTSDYMTIPPVWFPKEPTLVHYTAALFSYRGLQGLINSLIVASAATALSSLLGTMMAYSLAMRWPEKFAALVGIGSPGFGRWLDQLYARLRSDALGNPVWPWV